MIEVPDFLQKRTTETVSFLRRMRTLGLSLDLQNDSQALNPLFQRVRNLTQIGASCTVDYLSTRNTESFSQWDQNLVDVATDLYPLKPSSKYHYDIVSNQIKKLLHDFHPWFLMEEIFEVNEMKARYNQLVNQPTGLYAPLSSDYYLARIALEALNRSERSQFRLEPIISGLTTDQVLFPKDEQGNYPFTDSAFVTVLVDGNPRGYTRPLILSRVCEIYSDQKVVA